jgi:hypothetical protein
VLDEWNGEPAPADKRGETVERLVAAASAERRLRSAYVVGWPSRRTVSELTELSRAIRGLTSVGFLASTSRNTRSISDPEFPSDGDLVASGPVITTPI